MVPLKVDLHTHTRFSFDSWISPRRYVERAAAAGMGATAVTDHDTIEGALRVRDLDPPFRLIVGEEILTREGEIIGLFLREAVPGRLPVEETCDRVHAQGGLVMVSHPFCRTALDRLSAEGRERILGRLDIVEVINARNPSAASDREADRWARAIDAAPAANSDAHTPRELGRAYQFARPFDGPRDFLVALRDGAPRLERRTFIGLSLLAALHGLIRTGRLG